MNKEQKELYDAFIKKHKQLEKLQKEHDNQKKIERFHSGQSIKSYTYH